MIMKKLIALVLAAVMALGIVSAFAAAPSKTTTNVAKILDFEASGETPSDDFSIIIVEDSEEAAKELSVILEAVKGGKTPAECFPEGLLPADADLEMLEFFAVIANNYKPEYGDITIHAELGTVYQPDQEFYPLVKSNGAWGNAAGQIQDDGTVKITFNVEQMNAMNGQESLVALFSTPAK